MSAQQSLALNGYELVRELGRGGMAEVWLAHDTSTGQRCALKRIRPDKRRAPPRSAGAGPQDAHGEMRRVLFEGEYHMLAQLRHPHVVRVEDYGIAGGVPYYTMELLEGGDLHGRGVLPWRELCAVLRDVASALSLIHSRRFVHRDVTPRNVRFGSDGHARLIDFGALAPMGICRDVVGTPAFVPPEALNGQPLDARSDLYALGAVAYWALCARNAYPARTMRDLRDLWRSRPPDIATAVPDLPPALGSLITALLSLDPAARPASACEVYDRLCAIAELPRRDDVALAQAFLIAPKLIGRDEQLATVRRALQHARAGRGLALLVEGEPGVGRTRFLERCVLEAKLSGAVVLQVLPTDADRGEYGLVQALAEQLVAADARCAQALDPADAGWIAHAVPDLAERLGAQRRSEADHLRRRQYVHDALLRWFEASTRHKHLVITIDDLHVFDERSLAVVVGLTHACERLPLNVIASMPLGAAIDEGGALRRVVDGSARIKLRPLAREDFTELVRSLFADAAGATALAEHVYPLSEGRPAACMEIAQHLLDSNLVRHERGAWTLPSSLYDLELPGGVRELHERKLDALSDDARELAETLALSERPLPLEHYVELTSHRDSRRMHAAAQLLVSSGILARGSRGHTFADPGLRALLRERAASESRRAAHGRLARAFELTGAEAMEMAWHLLQAGEHARAADLALERWRRYGDDVGAQEIAWLPRLADTLEPLIAYCEREGRSLLEVFTLRQFLMVSTMWTRPGYALEIGHALERRLREDLGLVHWDEVSGASPLERITACLQRAMSAHDAAPPSQRGLHPVDALQHLGRHVLYATQCASASYRVADLRELVALIAPFAPLVPVLDLVHRTASAALAGMIGASEESHAALAHVLARLEQPDLGLPESHRHLFRLSVLFGLGMISVKWSDPRVPGWANELEGHVLHESNAWRLRKVYHLMEPNLPRAEACQERIDTLSLLERRERTGTVAFVELWTAAAYGDFSSLRRALAVTEDLTERYPEYLPVLQLGQGLHQLIGGNPEAAARSLEAATASLEHNGDLLRLAIGQDHLALAWIELGRYADARALLLRRMERSDAWMSTTMSAAILALCEALADEPDRALATAAGAVRSLDAQQLQGPFRAITLEYAARTALAAGDSQAFERYAQALSQMCEGDRCPSLRARHAAILKRAQRRDLAAKGLHARTSFPPPITTEARSDPLSNVRELLDRCRGPAERAECMLSLLVRTAHARHGFLYRIDPRDAFRLVASTAGAVPPDDLEPCLRERIAEWSLPSEALTVDLETVADAPSDQSGIFTARSGDCFQLVLLRAPISDHPVAAVALKIQGGEPRVIAFDLIQALGRALLDAGDVTVSRSVSG